MILSETVLYTADNSGAQIVKCIKVSGGFKKRYAYLGNIIDICLKKLHNREKLEKKKLYKGLIVGVSKKTKRKDGSFIKFDKNLILVLDKSEKFLGSRIYGPICKEIKNKTNQVRYKQIISYAKASI